MGGVSELRIFRVSVKHDALQEVLAKRIPYGEYGDDIEDDRATHATVEVEQALATRGVCADWAKKTSFLSARMGVSGLLCIHYDLMCKHAKILLATR